MNTFIKWLLGRIDSTQSSGISDTISAQDSCYLPETKLTFEETVAQMSRGYENTQRVIQFMDAKAGAVVALSLAIYAFVGKVVAWAFEQTDAAVFENLPLWLVCLLIVLGLAIMACGFVSLSFAFKTVRPNPLPSWGAFSTLFPAHGKDDEAKAVGYLKPLVEGADCGFCVDEFRRQLVAVGQIVHRKINWLRVSINWLWWQGLASVLLGGAIVGMAMSGALVKSPSAEISANVAEEASKSQEPIPVPLGSPPTTGVQSQTK